MSSLSRELVFLILQFLDEEKFKESVHKLEQESGFYFNMKHFEDQVQAGEWDEVEKYLSGFTKVEDNRYSMKIFFEIRKQKYLEALDKHDRAKAVEVLVKDLKVFASFNEELFKEITQLLTLENFRQNEQLSKYGDTKSARNIMLLELKKLIEANPLFRDKLAFPAFKASRLRTLINQSLNWQHQLCKNPRPNPDIKTLFIDHSCAPTNGARPPPPANGSLVGPIPKSGAFPPLGVHSPFPPVMSPSPSAIAGWMSSSNPSLAHAVVAQGPPGLVPPPNAAAFLKHPRTPTNAPGMDYQTADSEHLMKRMRTGPSDEVSFAGPSHPLTIYSQDDLPRTVVRTLNQGSNVTSLDFHPQQQTILLVGTNVGDIGIWEVGSRERIVNKTFKIREISNCSVPLQAALVKDATVSVSRCLWSPDGSILGVAFSKHIVQTFAFISNGELRQLLEIEAHTGGVNDIAFSHPNKSLSIITCGDDKTIKVWDATTGQKQYIFEGHEAPVYSVCPHYKENIQFIFSTAIDGKIKAWLYDCMGSRVDYDAPGLSCTTMAYSADGLRLFSCGTSKDGDSHLVEWNETEGAIKREYSGFRKRSPGVVQFDTTRNRFLAVGDESMIKFWDMDSTNILTTTEADGGLPASPRLRFNKEGSFLAVTTNDNGIKILANADGQRLIRMLESRALEGSRGASQHIHVKPSVGNAMNAVHNVSSSQIIAERSDRNSPALPMTNLATIDSTRTVDIKPRILDDVDKIKTWKLADIVDSGHLKALQLPDSMTTTAKVVRLLYTNSGLSLLALTLNGVHKLWKWQRTERNPSAKSTASIVPQLWQPANGIVMSNETGDNSMTEEPSGCIALSKNDSYVMSASGGKVSLFNMMTFKVMTTFMAPPPAATYLAFHPQDNNIIAIGMDDSTIQIYNVRIDEVKTKLKGHQKKITGLAFSQMMNVLVSSGADAQLCLWSIDGWEKRKAKSLQAPAGRAATLVGETKVQFHNDQVHLLVSHESQLAIYDGKLDCVRSWYPRDALSSPISSAIYSCDGALVYAGFCDGAVGIFDADSLRLRCRIAPSAYLSPVSSSSGSVYPTVIASHPSEPNQIALGMSDGAVYAVEPSDAEPKWGAPLPQDSVPLPPISSIPTSSSAQPSEPPPR
ncbi:YVTN repeat-like/Quinoprotein amine dehydrogenase protein [Dioscorea alata]|uniref:YVTN repeat-like/Quinoprotein amine dehydrogenase protein n=2 Tax=Dioscorea alata TaxID=55571 RepID=A0ACB7WWE4_DIOAL|nr:YVTN repeat-like/Quinoprotein amine dehydrogenase protein [Dioscorea alata]KAH7692893.1 YVTN repeat-like/Quinoprotein amine dehydrogenase protein [Dioscorea alata]